MDALGEIKSLKTRIMKYLRLLLVSVPTGILLSGCYVKHNPGAAAGGTPTAARAGTHYIPAHVVQDNNNQNYIECWTIDKFGTGDKHSENSTNNEDPPCTHSLQ
jgi:hypothetical protein